MKLCIVGTGRCGTQLLGSTFHGHPDFAVFNETHWIPKMYEFYGERKVRWRELLAIAENTFWVRGECLLEVNFNQSALTDYAAFHDELCVRLSRVGRVDIRDFSSILAGTLYGRPLDWGDKTPDYGYYLGLLHQLWPECRFIHITRRPLATVHSMAQHPGFRLMVASGHDNWCPLSYDHAYTRLQAADCGIEKYLSYWARRINRIRDEAGRLPPALYREVAYEDLVRRPAATLSELADFIGLSAPPEWLAELAGRVNPDRLVTHFQRTALARPAG